MRTLLVIKKRALNLSKFVNVELYCDASCQSCKLTRALFKEKGISFTEHRIDEDKDLKQAMFKRCNKKTIPQIFINKTHIGGYDELVLLNDNHQLDVLLGLAPSHDTSPANGSERRKTIITAE
jgi:glutaredoxin 3